MFTSAKGTNEPWCQTNEAIRVRPLHAQNSTLCSAHAQLKVDVSFLGVEVEGRPTGGSLSPSHRWTMKRTPSGDVHSYTPGHAIGRSHRPRQAEARVSRY